MLKAAAQLFVLLLPWPLRRPLLNLLFRYEIHPSARIGVSIVTVGRLVMGPHSRIGHLTLAKGLSELEIEESGLIGNLNWITAAPKDDRVFFLADVDRNPRLFVGRHAAITNRHLIDCTDSVSVGEFTTVGGWRSQILTHSIDIRQSRQSANPIRIGRYCFVGTGAILLKGSELPDYSVLAAGSVLTKKFERPLALYSGVPAVDAGSLPGDAAYFNRATGFIS